MTYYLISDREVVYDAATQASGSIYLLANLVNFTDPNPQIGSDSYMTINDTIYSGYPNNPVTINSLFYRLTVEQWDEFYNSQSFSNPTTPFENIVLCSLNYTLENMPTMFGLQPNEWILMSSSVSL